MLIQNILTCGWSCACIYSAIISFLLKDPIDENFNSIAQQEPEQYDFIIIGAGTAGCILANRLSKIKNWKILLLEAGDDEPKAVKVPAFGPLLQDSHLNWNYKTQPQKNACLQNNGCNWPRGKVMGGTSSINYMMYVRGNQEDYDTWERMGNPGWSYNNVLKYFRKSENNRDKKKLEKYPQCHKTGGYQLIDKLQYLDPNAKIVHKALEELGHQKTNINCETQLGSMIIQTTSFNGSRISANEAFIQPIKRKRRNLFIKKMVLVNKILIDPNTNKATGIEYFSIITGKNKTAKVKKEVILSAGTVNSPKLLMLSGIGPIDELKKHNIPIIKNLSVGHNLQDHVSFVGVTVNKSNNYSCKKKLQDLYHYWDTQRGPLAAMGLTSVTSFLQTKFATNNTAPDIQFMFGGDGKIFSYYDVFNVMVTLLTPASRGLIRLNNDEPLWGEPLIYPAYFESKEDIDRMLEAVRMALKLFNTTIFKENYFHLVKDTKPPCNKLLFNSDEYWLCQMRQYTSSTFHPVGTCKMGPREDSEAVVDARLRVYGIKGLRVIDASIMPLIPRGNTNSPTMMIAEKGSDMIKEDWLKKGT
ncbi:glucose dehydrogenase [FAD, quinone]-like [Leptopilina boulardi]|uniref:glucose dehydrogenase [FAD, quinone]-like n=1 Tax=Leptopilina boulardi TaxID=63433 RepID=UPI0021F58307|nr:glucose dehydrogenase [FAD, quinone]-like [Leptopilina boulardi]